MREIKFRAWDKKRSLMSRVANWIFPCKMGFGLIELKDQPATHEARYGYGELELMQYTGLKDKNGVEIYEGDGVKGSMLVAMRRVTLEITWEDAGFASRDTVTRDEYLVTRGNALNWEVIGNIYENPELVGE